MKTVIAGVAAAVALTAAPTASADQIEYVKVLDRYNLEYPSVGYVLSAGEEICQGLDDNLPQNVITADPDLTSVFTGPEIGLVFSTATAYLCPGSWRTYNLNKLPAA